LGVGQVHSSEFSATPLIPDLLTEWCSLCGNDRCYWPALKGSGISHYWLWR